VAVVKDHGSDVAHAAASEFRQHMMGRMFGGSKDIADIGKQFAAAASQIAPDAVEARHIPKPDKEIGTRGV
jgi:hypothetical protein